MTLTTDRDEARFSRPRHLPGVELVTVSYRDRSFPEHSHAEYVVGSIVTGAETLVVRGQPHVASAGDVLRLHPDEPHANSTLGAETLSYRVLYLPIQAVHPFLDPDGEPALTFETPVTRRPSLFRLVNQTHAALSDNDAGALEQQTALAELVRSLADPGRPRRRDTAPPAAIALARAFIDDRYAQGFGLDALADLTGLSVFHLVRSFKKAVGLSPLAYRNQRRVMEARGRLLAGEPIAQVALDMGYADQSHLTRQFQRILGISPGRYAQQ